MPVEVATPELLDGEPRGRGRRRRRAGAAARVAARAERPVLVRLPHQVQEVLPAAPPRQRMISIMRTHALTRPLRRATTIAAGIQ